jgi:hypothetical protein
VLTPLPSNTLFAVSDEELVPPLGTLNGAVRVKDVMLALEFVIEALAIVPPEITTLAKLLVPLPMPLMPLVITVKLLSS